MKFIDLHHDLANYFTPSRKFLGMEYSDFSKEERTVRHADIPGYREVGTKLLFCTVFPLSVGEDGIKCVDPKKMVSRDLGIIKSLIDKHEEFSVVKNRKDYNGLGNRIGVLLHMEGAEAITDPAQVSRYHKAGVRSIGLTWSYENDLAGGCSTPQVGLKKLGRQVLDEMASLDMILDLAHASSSTIRDALLYWKGPVLATHTAMKSMADFRQNLTDGEVREIIRRGGLVGIGFLNKFYGKKRPTISDVVEHLAYFRRKFGTRHLSIGSDYFGISLDDGVDGLYEIRCLPNLARELLRVGWEKSEVEGVFWKNADRFLKQALPKK
jgi:membrane dipeptidase